MGIAAGIRIPKVESADDAEWVAERAPATPLICAIETARGFGYKLTRTSEEAEAEG